MGCISIHPIFVLQNQVVVAQLHKEMSVCSIDVLEFKGFLQEIDDFGERNGLK